MKKSLGSHLMMHKAPKHPLEHSTNSLSQEFNKFPNIPPKNASISKINQNDRKRSGIPPQIKIKSLLNDALNTL